MTVITEMGSAIANIVTDTTHEQCDWTTAVPTNASGMYAAVSGGYLALNNAQSARVIGVVSAQINTLALSAINALVSAVVLSKTGYY